MARRSKKEIFKTQGKDNKEKESGLHPETKKSVGMVFFLALAVIFILAAAGQAGPAGSLLYRFLDKVFGWGYYLLPFIFFLAAFVWMTPDRRRLLLTTGLGGFLFLIAGLGLIDIIQPGKGGWAGVIIGSLKIPFGQTAAVVITVALIVVSFLVIINRPFRWPILRKKSEENISGMIMPPVLESLSASEAKEREIKEKEVKMVKEKKIKTEEAETALPKIAPRVFKNYVAPPLSLLSSSVEKPTIGDLRANANIIKRTLESFGLAVEMGEINVGPTITRYTLKPAEGIKLSRITALNQDLALALAAHPIRIEAPIPGKSLVGIEVPNKAAALVRLGSLLRYPEFEKSDVLTFALGRDVSGEPVFANIDKMPHLLIAGATGSGKSITVHSLIISLLFRNSPEILRFILIDPKRVELSVYNGLPHLIAPVIVENKKAIGALRWAIQEMENRYQTLLEAGARDIKAYNQRAAKPMPYILIIIDELADLMSSFGREVEVAIIRLAQMARATGLHLAVSTQRPSVEVITGLIKANITSRIALQVASQVDSRTILDTAGAEKLLGGGDLLFISAELSKPRRIQGGYVTEEEIKKVVNFIKENNKPIEEAAVSFESAKAIDNGNSNGGEFPPDFSELAESVDDDELYEQAVETVRAAKKASASLLQRRLKIGYARAARLLDIMEERGVIGPGEGAKPREVYFE